VARIFLCHASEDKAQVREVYHRLHAIDGFEPWLDEEDLLPGENSALEIQRALQTEALIIASATLCPLSLADGLSRRTERRRGDLD